MQRPRLEERLDGGLAGGGGVARLPESPVAGQQRQADLPGQAQAAPAFLQGHRASTLHLCGRLVARSQGRMFGQTQSHPMIHRAAAHTSSLLGGPPLTGHSMIGGTCRPLEIGVKP